VWSRPVFVLWQLAYRRVVRSSFATVPYYRHRWALEGRTDPVRPADAERALLDLIPLAGGRSEVDPERWLGSVLGGGPHGLIHDRLLGYLGALRGCGHWHLDWKRVYARETAAGLAFTLLRQDSPRFVDILLADGLRGRIEPCPRHGTPVVRT
jgi:hypothetical protein